MVVHRLFALTCSASSDREELEAKIESLRAELAKAQSVVQEKQEHLTLALETIEALKGVDSTQVAGAAAAAAAAESAPASTDAVSAAVLCCCICHESCFAEIGREASAARAQFEFTGVSEQAQTIAVSASPCSHRWLIDYTRCQAQSR